MPFVALLAGIVVLAITILDVVSTTLSPATREGPLTRMAGRRIWAALRALSGADAGTGRASRRWALIVAGPVILAVTVLQWMGWLLVGWWLVFNGAVDAVVSTSTAVPADAGERLYFVGYTIFTLGNGEFAPGGDAWQVAAVLATANGLLMTTLAITYLVPVVTAVTQRRQTAAMISGIGQDAAEILRRASSGAPWVFEQLLLDLSAQVVLTAERHLAYPLIHFFHSSDRASAFVPNVAALDVVVGHLQTAEDVDWSIDPVALRSYRQGVVQLLDAVHSPDSEGHRDHRDRLEAYVTDGGWSWEDVVGGHEDAPAPTSRGQLVR